MIPLDADLLISEDRNPKMKIEVHKAIAKVTNPLRIVVLLPNADYARETCFIS